ncbi:MAG: 3-oxoacyl-[acyl-carrier-protein] synthase III C-terminal domain-containing protein [Bryobacteraceae bacterium]
MLSGEREGPEAFPSTTGSQGRTGRGDQVDHHRGRNGHAKAPLHAGTIAGDGRPGPAARNLRRPDIRFWMLHSAGRKVLDIAARRLGLGEEAVGPSRYIFRNFGNISSATVVFVLERVMSAGNLVRGILP